MGSGRTWQRWLAATACAVAATAAAEIRVVGSDLLGLDFTRAFYASAGREGLSVALAFDGSRPGLAQLKAGRADLALLVLPPDEPIAPEGFRAVAFGYHAVAVVAPAACPLGEITLEQLAAVFGAAPPGSGRGAPRWGDLGLAGEWSSAAIVACVPESGSGLTAEYFRRVVLKHGVWRTGVQRYADGAALAGYFGDDSRALALVAAPPAGSTATKILAVATAARRPAQRPTADAIVLGAYPLRLPVHAVFRPERAAALRGVLAFVFGDEAARLLERAAITPLPAVERAAQRAQLAPR